MIRGGVLTVIKGEGIYVDFSRILWFKSPQQRQEIIKYWHSQGFAEPERLQYIYSDNCLEVERDLPEYGFFKGTGTLDEQIYNIPF
ncbi:hypothetical protein I8748_21440 [Nostoc sp. CENA67]|uniref:Uncharacterized protein n=1 Tax=Amazonocrinis nigriterrae CENA67 TaxID=2794033 RepID=A0A8J7LA42_9NOST|nr:hypothetical protein [Amazonocrinis nigriterrae]MBH8564715.1 hypothetical protein [Amazonocrinis nigriterrae CENA67]